MTKELSLLAEMRPPTLLSESEILRIKDEAEAVSYCWSMRRRKVTQKQAASDLGINQGVFSQVLNGKRSMPPNKRILFQWYCGNWALTQWESCQAQIPFNMPKRRASDFGGRRQSSEARYSA